MPSTTCWHPKPLGPHRYPPRAAQPRRDIIVECSRIGEQWRHPKHSRIHFRRTTLISDEGPLEQRRDRSRARQSRSKDPTRSWRRPELLVPIIIGLLASVGVVVAGTIDRSQTKPLAFGRIETPRDGQQVESVFLAAGVVRGMSSGEHAWLAVQYEGTVRPLGVEILQRDSRWSVEVNLGEVDVDTARTFSLLLLKVGETGHRQIWAWRDRVDVAVPLPSITGLVILDSVQSLASRTPRIMVPRSTAQPIR